MINSLIAINGIPIKDFIGEMPIPPYIEGNNIIKSLEDWVKHYIHHLDPEEKTQVFIIKLEVPKEIKNYQVTRIPSYTVSELP